MVRPKGWDRVGSLSYEEVDWLVARDGSLEAFGEHILEVGWVQAKADLVADMEVGS